MGPRKPSSGCVTVVGPATLFLDTLVKALCNWGLPAKLVPSLERGGPLGVVIVDAGIPSQQLTSVVQSVRAAGPHSRILLLLERADPAGRRLATCLQVDGWVTRQDPLDKVVQSVSRCTRQASTSPQPADATPAPGALVPPVTLTAREVEILAVVAGGLSDTATAERLRISVHTVRSHLRSARVKLGAANRFAAVASARSCGALDAASPGLG